MFLLLRKHRGAINPPGLSEEEAYLRRQSLPEIDCVRDLFSSFKPQYWGYEPVELLRRSMMMVPAAISRKNFPFGRPYLALIIAIFWAMVESQVKPWKEADSPSILRVGPVYGRGFSIPVTVNGFASFLIWLVVVVSPFTSRTILVLSFSARIPSQVYACAVLLSVSPLEPRSRLWCLLTLR